MPRLKPALCLLPLLLLAALAGCGQSGPLYLPGNPSQVTTVPPEAAEEQKEDDENGDSQSDDR